MNKLQKARTRFIISMLFIVILSVVSFFVSMSLLSLIKDHMFGPNYIDVPQIHTLSIANIYIPKDNKNDSRVIVEPQSIPQGPQYIHNITDAEYQLLANLIYYESNIEPIECQMAVAQTVFNRLTNEKFPDTIVEIIFQEDQFQPAGAGVLWNANPTETNYEALERVLLGEKIIPDNVTYFWASYIDVETPGSWFYDMHQSKFYTTLSRTNFYYD